MMKRLLVVTTGLLFCGGCFLFSFLGRVAVTTVPATDTLARIAVELTASVTTAVCENPDPAQPDLRECTYFVDGVAIGSTSSFLSDFGLLGVIIDPVIAQVPADAFAFTGTFAGASASGNLRITPGLASVPVDANRSIAAEAGTQLVIVDFPASPAPPMGSYDFNLTFDRPPVPLNVQSVPVKILFAGRIDIGGQSYYPPLLPCTTNMASVPSVTIPLGATMQPIALADAVAQLQGCTGEVYDYRGLGDGGGEPVAVPALSTWGFAALAVLLSGVAVVVLRRMAP